MPSQTVLEKESIALWREYGRTRDVALRNGLVLQHMGLVYQIASKYAALARDAYDDLIQEGCLGLLRAIERFRPDYGVQFSTYAYPVISGTIKNYLRDRRRLLGQPRWERGEEAEFGRTEFAPLEGEELLAPDAIEAVAAQVEDDFTEEIVDRMLATALLARLPLLERRIVQHFFYDDLTQREVARIVARSTSRISRILRQALDKIRGLLLDIQKEETRLITPGGQPLIIVPSVVDAETGLFGPQHLYRSLGREVSRAQALKAPLTLALVRPNDGAGPVTPAALSAAAKRIYQQVRVLDYVFRAGPTELALIFSLPPKETQVVCQRFQRGAPAEDLHCALASYPQDAVTARDLLDAARARLDAGQPTTLV
jgi:RNA polymerase sigma factor (sigma-70 family)